MDERYGKAMSQEIRDTQWIEEAALAGDVLLWKDLEIAHNPLEAQVVYMTSARLEVDLAEFREEGLLP